MNNSNKDVFLNIGYGNSVNVNRVTAILSVPSASASKILDRAQEMDVYIDATAGRKTRTLLIMDTGTVVASGVNSTTITARKNCMAGIEEE